MFTGEDGVLGDAGGVYHTGGGETAHFGGFWGELGVRDASGGCSDVSGGVLLRSWAVVCVPERGRAGGIAVVEERVVDDVAGRMDA